MTPFLHNFEREFRIELLVLQPTPFCNIDCSYCYLPNRNNRARMDFQVVDAVFAKILSSRLIQGELSIAWHAGEPLAVPIDWYKRAFEIAERYRPSGLKLTHLFQSNGTLINSEWCRFFKESGARVALSIDGPNWVHDSARIDRKGEGTYARGIRGLRLLQEFEIDPGVLTVLRKESLRNPSAMYSFYKDNRIRDVSFNIEETESMNERHSIDENYESLYKLFMSNFIDFVLADSNPPEIRELRNALGVLRAGVMPGRNQEADPMSIVSVSYSGLLSTFSPEFLGMEDISYNNFTFGNILTTSIDELMNNILESALHKAIRAGVLRCKATCDWFDVCGGGSPSNKYYENGSVESTETAFCRVTTQGLIGTVLQKLETGQIAAWEV